MHTQTVWDYRYLDVAKVICDWSKDPVYKHSCIAVKDNRIISTGYNGYPAGADDSDMYDREIKRAKVIHAEKNCIYNCLLPEKLKGSTFYIWGLKVSPYGFNSYGGLTCCMSCASAMIQVGVKRIVMKERALLSLEEYKDDPPYFQESALRYLRDNGVQIDFLK